MQLEGLQKLTFDKMFQKKRYTRALVYLLMNFPLQLRLDKCRLHALHVVEVGCNRLHIE